MKTVRLEVKQFDDVLKEVGDACKTGNTTETTISFDSAVSLWKIISPAKQQILHVMSGSGVIGVRELARQVGRDVSAIHRDLQVLIVTGIVDRAENGEVIFPYDDVHVDFRLSGAA